jgi:uncharacterized membrane protein YccC
MSAVFLDARPAPPGCLHWLRRELAPSHDRKVRTLILTCGAVLCVILSMALQVPQLATSGYMVFFISKESKTVTTLVGVLGLFGLTIGIAVSLLLYKFTYGHPELRIPSMAMVLFLGMYASRILVIGPLGFLLGFVIAVTQSIGDLLPSPELLLRAILWIWVALAYAVGLTVILNRLFLPQPTGPPQHLPKPKSLFVPDAFTNPAHLRFALKVTVAAMFCYLLYTGIDWFGIHTAFITCVFIALESTGATLRKGMLRAVGCIIGGLLALFSIVFLIPHMETIASLVVLVACVSAIAGWVATGSERISYAGLQIAFAFYYGLFPGFEGFAPSTDLDNLRNRVVGILLGLMVTALVFHYIWPERAIDRLRSILSEVLQQFAKLLVIPSPETPVKQAKPKAEALFTEISRELVQAKHEAELSNFEIEGTPPRGSVSLRHLESILARAERLLAFATSLTSDSAWQEWQHMPPDVQAAESALRNAVARRLELAANGASTEGADSDLSSALARWTETIQRLSLQGSRIALISQIATEAKHFGSQPQGELVHSPRNSPALNAC